MALRAETNAETTSNEDNDNKVIPSEKNYMMLISEKEYTVNYKKLIEDILNNAEFKTCIDNSVKFLKE